MRRNNAKRMLSIVLIGTILLNHLTAYAGEPGSSYGSYAQTATGTASDCDLDWDETDYDFDHNLDAAVPTATDSDMPWLDTPIDLINDLELATASNLSLAGEGSSYDYIKELLVQDEDIDFDPETQTILVITTKQKQSEHLQSLGISDVDDLLKQSNLCIYITVNDAELPNGTNYYIFSKDTDTYEKCEISNYWGSGKDNLYLSTDEDKITVLILDQGDTYKVYSEVDSSIYYSCRRISYNGNGLLFRPENNTMKTEFSGTADDQVAETGFSFVWDLCNWLDVEICLAEPTIKSLDNPGFIDVDGYINFQIELRDSDGTISLLPKTIFSNYGSENSYIYMEEDGILPIFLGGYEQNPNSDPYGEFDIYIPFGYDYRISLVDYSVDTLGGYAYVMNQEHEYDADGFCITDKSLVYSEDNEWGTWITYNFMPCTKEIKVEKQAEGNAPTDQEYTFSAKQNAYTFCEDAQAFYQENRTIVQALSCYPYDLYDSKSNEKLSSEPLKTDADGTFSLKSGQYALFPVWETPEDLIDYDAWGTNFIRDIYQSLDEVATQSKYSFEELKSTDCTTTITHTSGNSEQVIEGKRIEGVIGNDQILFKNVYGGSTTATGSLTISTDVSGNGIPDANTEFEFAIEKDGKPVVSQYQIGEGMVQPIPTDGKIHLKAGESALITKLNTGEYTVTETKPEQKHYETTCFSVNNNLKENGLTATVTVTSASAATTGGWQTQNGTITKDADGYFVYTITEDQIAGDGTITVDCDPLAEYMEYAMRDYQNFYAVNFKVKFVNETGMTIQYKDFDFDTVNWLPVGETYTPSEHPTMQNTDEGADEYSAGYGWGEAWQSLYPMIAGERLATTTFDAEGFDGNPIRLAIAPLRCINPAIVSYFKSNSGYGTLSGNRSINSASDITLLQMNAFPELIKQAFTFHDHQGNEISLEADPNRTYADFLCAFYDVTSLNELTVTQKYNVLGTGYKGSMGATYSGQANITCYYANTWGKFANWCIPYRALNDGTLDQFQTWGLSNHRISAGKKLYSGGQIFSEEDAEAYAYQQSYYLLESDPTVLTMAYDYLYDRCIRFSFDNDNRAISTGWDDSTSPAEDVSGIKSYMDKTDAAKANVLSAMNHGNAIADQETLTLDRIKGYIEVPNAWNTFRYYDFGFKLIFEAEEIPDTPQAASVAFINAYNYTDTPNTPDTPSTPDTPNTPDTPETPDTPSTPDTPNTPDTPETPVVYTQPLPDTPQTAAVPQMDPAPQTGDTFQLGWYLSMMILSLLGIAITKKSFFETKNL